MGVSSSRERGDEPDARSSDAAVCTVLMALAAQLAAMDNHGWKLSPCLLCALGTDQSSARDDTATRWSARVAKIA